MLGEFAVVVKQKPLESTDKTMDARHRCSYLIGRFFCFFLQMSDARTIQEGAYIYTYMENV